MLAFTTPPLPLCLHRAPCKSLPHSRSSCERVVVRRTLLATAAFDFDATKQYLEEKFPLAQKCTSSNGEVFLVGAGPGDPRLLTLGAVELLRTADVVLYDRLVSDDVLAFAQDGAELICVGKARGIGTGSQQSIQEQLIQHAALGKRVVRLKGGDPVIFGRLGDEVEFLRGKGLNPLIEPGVTAASGVAAILGFSLTHGGLAESVRIFTGHLGANTDFRIGQVVEGTTMVIYMGLRELQSMLKQLVECGAREDLPAVAVQSGTLTKQRVVWGTVKSLPDRVTVAGLQSPTLVIIGEVVRMARDWKEDTGPSSNIRGRQL